ncbi:uncharacterized protein LOC132609685 [Lycium barbarum]|uniref:uncharacterized protein LOC132609685 n=1 Tax=Lycium barbarum TaxID=112863 RepID=UPI00293ECDD5|nr:uncharacterized protein LOC132609685 [Lycium barbarum]
MAKAYDRLSWDFLISVLRKFGFSEIWIDLMWGLISEVWYSIVINGVRRGFYTSSQGLKQGDPLSPSLFIIAAEVLTRSLNSLNNEPDFIPFHMNKRGPQINHLAYADDIVIFCSGKQSSINLVMSHIEKYENASGQKINGEKSLFITDPKASAQRINKMRNCTGFMEKSFPFTYLGCSLYKGRKKLIYFENMAMKVANRLNSWQGNMLTFGGKMIMIKNVLQSLPIYTLSAMSPPKGTLTLIEKYFARWWRFRTNTTLWGTFMRAKYCSRSHPAAKKWVPGNSHAWKRMLQIRDKVENNMLWKINVGNCSLWWDNWSDKGALANLFPDHHHNRHTTISSYINNGAWDSSKITLDFGDRNHNIFANTDIGDPSLEDFIIWKPTSDGLYTNSSAFQVNRRRKQDDETLSSLWHNCIPLKISFLGWRACLSKLPFNENLARLGIVDNSNCRCCNTPIRDSMQHTLVEGQAAKYLWESFGSPLGIRHRNWPIKRILKLWRDTATHNSVHKLLVNIVPLVICWEIWRNWTACKYGEQDRLYFRKMRHQVSWTIDAALAKAFPSSIGHGTISAMKSRGGNQKQYFITLNGTNQRRAGSHNIAEATTAMEGIQQCLRLGYKEIHLESDSQIIVDMLNARTTNNLKLKRIILNTAKLMEHAEVKVTHCYREANQVADLLAKSVANVDISTQYNSYTQLPGNIKGSFFMDS